MQALKRVIPKMLFSSFSTTESRSRPMLTAIRRILIVGVVLTVSPLARSVAESVETDDQWVLVFRDDFERTELGDDWSSNDAVIRDGRMLLGFNRPACAKIALSFPSDVRLRFTALANEKKPPCDLSVTLAAERFQVMSWNYLLAFGGVNNTVNKLTGGRKQTCALFQDWYRCTNAEHGGIGNGDNRRV